MKQHDLWQEDYHLLGIELLIQKCASTWNPLMEHLAQASHGLPPQPTKLIQGVLREQG